MDHDPLFNTMSDNMDNTIDEKKEFRPFPHDLHGDYPSTQPKQGEWGGAKAEALKKASIWEAVS
jgi:hypothetical protein